MTAPAIERTRRPESDDDVDLERPWVAIVWNDPINLMSYVAWVFQQLFGYSKEKANRLMLDVHTRGGRGVHRQPRAGRARRRATACRRAVGHRGAGLTRWARYAVAGGGSGSTSTTTRWRWCCCADRHRCSSCSATATRRPSRGRSAGRQRDPDELGAAARRDRSGPVETPRDPALLRLLPDGYRNDDDAAGEFRRLTESGLRATKRAALQRLVDDLTSAARAGTRTAVPDRPRRGRAPGVAAGDHGPAAGVRHPDRGDRGHGRRAGDRGRRTRRARPRSPRTTGCPGAGRDRRSADRR